MECNSQIDRITWTLKFYYKYPKVPNFIFICHKDLQLKDIHKLFLVFKEYYLFEFERVIKIDKVACIVIYVSIHPEFLKIDNTALREFIMDKF
jgi:hypothetical protein